MENSGAACKAKGKQMIAITGAGGKTGRALIQALARRNLAVRAVVRSAGFSESLRALGATDVAEAEFAATNQLAVAFAGAAAVYHICPNMHPAEVEIARYVVEAARRAGVSRIVYHSVLHPQVEAMPHHWQKMRVEEMLFTAGVDFTILQPAAYMQNLQAYFPAVCGEGIYRVPYAAHTRLGMVDLDDVAAAAAAVLSEPGHAGAIYELANGEAYSQAEVAALLSELLGRTVRCEAIARPAWSVSARAGGLPAYAVETLLRMFEYYEAHGFWGNATILGALLARKPVTLRAWLQRSLADACL